MSSASSPTSPATAPTPDRPTTPMPVTNLQSDEHEKADVDVDAESVSLPVSPICSAVPALKETEEPHPVVPGSTPTPSPTTPCHVFISEFSTRDGGEDLSNESLQSLSIEEEDRVTGSEEAKDLDSASEYEEDNNEDKCDIDNGADRATSPMSMTSEHEEVHAALSHSDTSPPSPYEFALVSHSTFKSDEHSSPSLNNISSSPTRSEINAGANLHETFDAFVSLKQKEKVREEEIDEKIKAKKGVGEGIARLISKMGLQ